MKKNIDQDLKKNCWILKQVKSEITAKDIEKIENKYKIKYPEIYKEFLKAYYWQLENMPISYTGGTLGGKRFNIISGNSENHLSDLETLYKEFSELLKNKFIPIAVSNKNSLDECIVLCISNNEENIICAIQIRKNVGKEFWKNKYPVYKNFEECIKYFLNKRSCQLNYIRLYTDQNGIVNSSAKKDLGFPETWFQHKIHIPFWIRKYSTGKIAENKDEEFLNELWKFILVRDDSFYNIRSGEGRKEFNFYEDSLINNFQGMGAEAYISYIKDYTFIPKNNKCIKIPAKIFSYFYTFNLVPRKSFRKLVVESPKPGNEKYIKKVKPFYMKGSFLPDETGWCPYCMKNTKMNYAYSVTEYKGNVTSLHYNSSEKNKKEKMICIECMNFIEISNEKK